MGIAQVENRTNQRFVPGISVLFYCECYIKMRMQYTMNLNPGRFELGT